jgi:two-component system chemotaxis sensor kinase CheA
MVDAELLDTFQTEARELLRRAGVAAMQLEVARAADMQEPLRALARDLHTLKGSSGTLDLDATTAMSHEVHALETLLRDAEPKGELAAAATEAVEAIERWTSLVEALTITPAAGDGSLGFPVPGIEGFFLFEEPVGATNRPDDAAPQAAQPRPEAPVAEARTAQPVALLRIHPDRLDAAHRAASELLVSRLEGDAITQDLVALRDAARALEQRCREAQRAGASSALAEIRTEAATLASGSARLAQRSVAHRDRSTTWIIAAEASIRRLRWMPVEPFLHELVPVVRHASKAVGRKIRFDVDGGGVEVDRQVLTGLRDGLLHMVRNSVVHGVEDEDERIRRGKDPVGTIWVRAASHGGRVRFEIGDDGRGVDVRAIIEKAITKGLIGPEVERDAATALRVLVTPGFSTASQVDDLAGRGVGMNVVYDQILALGGQMTLDPGPGTGARFAIDVPIRASTTPGLVVRVGEHRFGVPLRPIERVLRVRDDELGDRRYPTVLVEGVAISVATVADALRLPPGDGDHRSHPVLVVRDGPRRLGLLVDDVLGELEMVIKPLPKAFASARRYLGGAIQADGAVLAVLDVVAMLDDVATRGSRGLPADTRVRSPKILVAESSPVLRALLVNMLRRAGCTPEPVSDEGWAAKMTAGAYAGAVVGSAALLRDPRAWVDRPVLGVALDAAEERAVASVGAPVWRLDQTDATRLSAQLHDAGWFRGEA